MSSIARYRWAEHPMVTTFEVLLPPSRASGRALSVTH
jgi:hypothetical protein